MRDDSPAITGSTLIGLDPARISAGEKAPVRRGDPTNPMGRGDDLPPILYFEEKALARLHGGTGSSSSSIGGSIPPSSVDGLMPVPQQELEINT